RTRILGGAAALLAAAVLGAGLALGGAAAFGGIGKKTTTVREIQAAVSPAASSIRQGRSLSINQIYRHAAPGVVQVTSTTLVTVPADPFFGNTFFPQQQQEQSLGSGFVVDKAGHIVTNYHVIDRLEHEGDGPGTRPVQRPRGAEDRRQPAGAHAAPARRLRHDGGRGPGGRDRQPVRPRPNRHRRDRQRDPAGDRRPQRLHDRP